MKLTLAEPRYLKDSISIISDLVNEGRFKITPDAIELIAMDPANVAMVIFKLLSSSFTEYDVKEATEIQLNLGNLKQVLRRAKPDDVLTLEMEDNKLKVQLKGTSVRTFSLPLLDMEEKEQRVPELAFPISIVTNAGILNDAIEDVDIVAEAVNFVAEDKKFSIQAEGDISKARIDIGAGEHIKIETKSSGKIKSKYSVEYLKKMIAGAKVAPTVKIQFNKDYPLRLDFVEVDKVSLSFILAPRIEND